MPFFSSALLPPPRRRVFSCYTHTLSLSLASFSASFTSSRFLSFCLSLFFLLFRSQFFFSCSLFFFFPFSLFLSRSFLFLASLLLRSLQYLLPCLTLVPCSACMPLRHLLYHAHVFVCLCVSPSNSTSISAPLRVSHAFLTSHACSSHFPLFLAAQQHKRAKRGGAA